ncbi:MAG: ABC transporter ATP-binding protein [Eubacteriaceae bacterium]|nr:ABC transporter ATP-binding protein [Eubacteriaceae bacterium]
MENALEIKGLKKVYDRFVLDNVNITLPQGCIMGFIGENGAGKSTTIKLILGLIKKNSGEIKILGSTQNNNEENIKEHIGAVIDESCFPDNLCVNDINMILKNIYSTWEEQKFLYYADKFSLPVKEAVKNYSRGMKMKLSIAVALSHDSKLLILDEATSGLDPIIRDEILDVFLDFIQDETHSIFMSSHIISDLEKVCDYITFIHEGKIIFCESKDELKEKFGILKCSENEFLNIDKSIIKGYRKNNFGVEALVYKDKIKKDYTIDNASIEDIMLYYIKEQ